MYNIIASTIPDVTEWFSPASVFSLFGIIFFIICYIFVFWKKAIGVFIFILVGWFWVGISTPSWTDSKINGYSKMSVYHHYPTQTVGYRIDRRVFEFDKEREKREGRNSTSEFDNRSKSLGLPVILAMHYPEPFTDPDPRVRRISQVSPNIWHPACLFWSPFFALLIGLILRKLV